VYFWVPLLARNALAFLPQKTHRLVQPLVTSGRPQPLHVTMATR
jgi:hypothetical protein